MKMEGLDEEADDNAAVVVPNDVDDKKLLVASDILFQFTTFYGKNKLCLIMAVIYFIVASFLINKSNHHVNRITLLLQLQK